MNFNDLPAIGQPLDAGTFVGLTTKPDGTHHAVVLLADRSEKRLPWRASLAWAKKLKAELPTRPVAALLFANAKAQFESDWHWTSEAYDSSYAWYQGFDLGSQSDDIKSFEARARAVRLIQLTL